MFRIQKSKAIDYSLFFGLQILLFFQYNISILLVKTSLICVCFSVKIVKFFVAFSKPLHGASNDDVGE